MYLLDAITRNSLMPIRTTGAYSFCRNRRTSFPDIVNVNRRMRQKWRSSSVMGWYPASDLRYILHRFLLYGRRQVEGSLSFRYSTMNTDERKFLRNLDERINFMDYDDTNDKNARMPRILPPRGKKCLKYWWNDESDLRRTTLR